jgi:multicomponent K+:H+ antiporter subunit G
MLTEALTSLLILIGAFFTLVGSIGLFRLQDFMSRLHGPTKATTLGVGGVLLASLLYFGTHGDGISLHELLIGMFLFITAPVSAHLLAKAAMHLRLHSKASLPGAVHDPET